MQNDVAYLAQASRSSRVFTLLAPSRAFAVLTAILVAVGVAVGQESGTVDSTSGTARPGNAQGANENVAEALLAPFYQYQADKKSEISGDSLPLARVLYGVYSPYERRARLVAYWDLSYKFARFNLANQYRAYAEDCANELAKKYGGAASIPADALELVNSAKQIAEERRADARLTFLQAQYDFDAAFTTAVGRRVAMARAVETGAFESTSGAVLYVPTTPPSTGAYNSRYAEMSSYRRLSAEAQRLNALLPLLYESLQTRSRQAARSFQTLLNTFRAISSSSDPALFDALDAYLKAHDEALKAATRYNQAIASYVAETVPGNVQGAALLATLNQRVDAQSAAQPRARQNSTQTPSADAVPTNAPSQRPDVSTAPAGNGFSFYLPGLNPIHSNSTNSTAPDQENAPSVKFASLYDPGIALPDDYSSVLASARSGVRPAVYQSPDAQRLVSSLRLTSYSSPATAPTPAPEPETKPEPLPQVQSVAQPEPVQPAPETPEPPQTQEPDPPEKPIVAEREAELPPIIVLATGFEQPDAKFENAARPRERATEAEGTGDGAWRAIGEKDAIASFFSRLLGESRDEKAWKLASESRVERGQDATVGDQSASENAAVSKEELAARRANAATRALFPIVAPDLTTQKRGEEERLFSLQEVATRASSSPFSRSATAIAYWRLHGAAARLRVEEVTFQNYARVLEKARNDASPLEETCLSAALEEQARVVEARAFKRSAQSALLRVMGLDSETSAYPLPSTQPFCGRSYDLAASNALDFNARRRGALVLARLNAVHALGDQFSSPTDPLSFDANQSNDLELALATIARKREQALLFVDHIVTLNCLIAEYVAFYPRQPSTDRFVEALVGRGG